jgi:transcriptional regulator with PAS, ATPase and Fis domain
VITASNRDLFEMSKKKKFRPDLYHRLSTFVIEIPPLRERRDDIPPLLEYYIFYYADQLGKTIEKIDPEITQKLLAYDFPGNVRELRNMIERALILCDKKTIAWDNFRYSIPVDEDDTESTLLKEEDLDLEKIEKKVILKALERAGNNKTKAAEMLNITWQSLKRRMEKYQIN